MNRKLYKHEDNAFGRLNAGISAGTLTIPLQSGQGALLPVTANGAATSLGSSTVLNDTGIQAALTAGGFGVGDIIENVTDGSYAIIKSVATNAIVTTRLKGGTDNTWQNSDVWAVNRFIVTLVKYDVDGETVLQREKVLIESRSGDDLTVNASGRGFDGSTAASFATGDYVYMYLTSCALDGIHQSIAQAYVDIDSLLDADADVAKLSVPNTWGAVQTLTADLLQITTDPDSANDAVRYSYLQTQLGSDIYGDASDGTFAQSSGLTTWNTAGKNIYQFGDFSLTGTASLTIGSNLYGKPIYVLVNGDLTITSSATPAVNFAGVGAAPGSGGAGGAQNGITNMPGSAGSVGTASAYRVLATAPTGGSPGLNGARGGGGGGGGGGVGNSGVAGSIDGSGTNAGGTAGAGESWDADALMSFFKSRPGVGSGGAGGAGGCNSTSGSNGSGGNGGTGGRGGGAIFFIVRGSINITSQFSVAGAVGSNGANGAGGTPGGGGGGGGGGGAGTVGIFHKGSVTANAATFTVTAGAGGSGGTGTFAGGAGGAGGAGQSIVKNIVI